MLNPIITRARTFAVNEDLVWRVNKTKIIFWITDFLQNMFRRNLWNCRALTLWVRKILAKLVKNASFFRKYQRTHRRRNFVIAEKNEKFKNHCQKYRHDVVLFVKIKHGLERRDFFHFYSNIAQVFHKIETQIGDHYNSRFLAWDEKIFSCWIMLTTPCLWGPINNRFLQH